MAADESRPGIDRQTIAVAVSVVVLLLLTLILREHYARFPEPESLAGRAFVALFGSWRLFITWPLIPMAVALVFAVITRLRRASRGRGNLS